MATLVVAVAAMQAGPDGVNSRARRAYDAGEWASAQALYAIASQNSSDAGLHARMVAAAEMYGDTAAAVPAIERAMTAGVPLAAMLDSVETYLRSQGRHAAYCTMLQRLADERPYLRRPVDVRMLNYAKARRDGAAMVKYARRLLAGLPDNADYIDALAWGLLYCGDYDGAEKAWRQGIETDGDNAVMLINLALLLVDSRPDEALTLLQRAYATRPTPALAAQIKALQDSLQKAAD